MVNVQDIQVQIPWREFIQILKEGLSGHTAYLAHRADARFFQGVNETELVGYADDAAVYLLPESTFKFVDKFLRDRSRGPVNDRHIKRSHVENGLLFNCQEGRYDRITRCDRRNLRVMWIRRDALLDDCASPTA